MTDHTKAQALSLQAASVTSTVLGEHLGLSLDMLDVDRLREWARLLLVHGADISHWASVPHVVGKMQALATDVERAIRDIGTLRAMRSLHGTRVARDRVLYRGTLVGLLPVCDADPGPLADRIKRFVNQALRESEKLSSSVQDAVCEHGTALDGHYCNCYGGFLSDPDSCVCEFEAVVKAREAGSADAVPTSPDGEHKREAIQSADPHEERWQPIETYDKNGEPWVLLWWPYWRSRPVLGRWSATIDDWWSDVALEGYSEPPTHWMPLPKPPADPS